MSETDTDQEKPDNRMGLAPVFAAVFAVLAAVPWYAPYLT